MHINPCSDWDCKTPISEHVRRSLIVPCMGCSDVTLMLQWKKNVTTDEIVRLLSNIRSFVDMPQRIISLQDTKVSLLVLQSQCLTSHEGIVVRNSCATDFLPRKPLSPGQ